MLAWAGFWIVVVAILGALDLWDDLHDDKAAWILSLHVVFSIIAFSVACSFGLQVVRLQRRVHLLGERLQLPGPDRDAWQSHSADAWPAFALAIQKQFVSWDLTGDEKQVALLLLNGLSAPRISELRKIDLRTIDQQIAEIYRKAGLSGRADLTAFFFSESGSLALRVGAPPSTGSRRRSPAA